MDIRLNEHKAKNEKVLSGRPNGEKLRHKLNLDQLDKTETLINIFVPDELFSINSSFFLGLFGKSIRSLGEAKFRERFIFHCDEVILNNIEDGISRALKESDSLKGK